jgi:predicted metal-dependent hydrolase
MDRREDGRAVPSFLKQLQLPFDVSPTAAAPGRPHQVRLAGGIFGYRLVRAHRRSIALCVGTDGMEVRAPRHATLAEIEDFIQRKEPWIRKRLAEPRRQPFVWETGARLPWLGETLTLALQPDWTGANFSVGLLELGLADGSSPRERGLEWMRDRALVFFRERCEVLAGPLGLHVPAVGLSNARTRWGSCSEAGRVLLNWRLMMMPPRLVDYVVAHELAHLRELNHSAQFWEVVGALYPDYRPARRELTQTSRTLPEL